ncbi:MAG TPA: LpqB family beta-propeller domain-containing protein, partial [Dongiaceae bacterium]|nr:LpqB family beta-propeller domain-containing protein [Dongiaceae bacterium]
MKLTVLSIVLLLCLSSVSHGARLDTSFVFSTIETPHFSIHFHQGLEGVARKAAVIAEEAHDKLVREFIWEPGGKTELVLIDDSDFTNGFATALPDNTIFIHVVPPNLASTLAEYDDWLKVMITHEYTHIVTLDASRGYSKFTRAIFGKPIPGADPLSELLFLVTAPPNSFMPRWWHEGMAVWAETEFTGVGRGRSSYFDMIFRMAVAGNNLPTIAQINGDVPYWPAGSLPYIFGYRLQRYIADTYGKDALGKLSIAHSGRLPYLIDAPPQELFDGKSYDNLYGDMITALKKEESQRIADLSRLPFTPLQTLSNRGESLTNPRYSPDGSRIAFTRHDPHDHTVVVVTDRSGSSVLAEFRRLFSDGSICWSPDGGSLYFTQSENNSGFNTYQDLYEYDFASDSTTRLTYGRRLGDVDLSPDGRRFAAVVSFRGSQNLVLIETSGAEKVAKPRPVTGYSLQRVSSPRWSPDGKAVSYAVTDNSGRTAIRLYDANSGGDRTLFSVSHTASYPVWSRDGSFLIYVSDETGVFNLFAYDLKEGKSYQVSHLLGGALQPDLSPDGREIIFSSYDSHGFSIAQMPLDREKWLAGRGPSLPAGRAVTVPAGSGSAGEGGGAAQAAASPYNSLRTLFPTFWLPRISGDGSGTPVFGLLTAGADVLGYNSFSITADYGSERKRGYFNINFRNDTFYPTLFLRAHSEPLLYTNLLQRGDYYELNRGVSLEASVPVNSLESHYRINGGYQLQDQKALSSLDSKGLFNGVQVFQGRRDNLFTGISFDNVLRYPYSISSEEGRRISLLVRRFGRELGNTRDLSEYSAVYQEFLRLPTASPTHQVLYLRLAGALADSSQTYAQQSFQIGGIPSELNPYPLRGYPVRLAAGKYVATGTLEYRAPLFFPMYGPGTF